MTINPDSQYLSSKHTNIYHLNIPIFII